MDLKEEINVIQACNAMINEETFEMWLRKEMYKAYKNVISQGKSFVCRNCKCCDQEKKKCNSPTLVEEKMKFCWQATNITLLKKEGFYGTPRNN